MNDPNYSKGVLLVLIAGSMWSIAGLVIRLIDDANEWQILFYRSLTLSLFLFFYIGFTYRGPLLRAYTAPGPGAAIAGISLGLAFASWIFAMTHTTIANALFILSSAPFITAVLGKLILGESVKRLTIICMSVAAIGVSIMVIEGALIGSLLGNVFALGASCGFALFTVLLRRTRSVDMTPAVFWAGISGMIIGATAIIFNNSTFVISHHDFEMCAIMGLVQVGIGLIIYIAGSKYVPAAELALLSLIEVMLGPIWVWLGVGEIPSFYTMVGGAVILSAIAFQAIAGIRNNRIIV